MYIGYGRAYRNNIYNNWGQVDVDDVANAIAYIIDINLADKDKIALHGESAGIYIFICVYIYMYVCIYKYIYTYMYA